MNRRTTAFVVVHMLTVKILASTLGPVGAFHGNKTPGYWKQYYHNDKVATAWGETGYSPNDSFNDIFGVGPDITLMAALNSGGGGVMALLRHATAGLLNAAHPDSVYWYNSPGDVIAAVQAAYASGDFEDSKDLFEYFNMEE